MSLVYQKKNTGIHALNPLVKLVVIAIFIVLGSIYSHPIYLIVLIFTILMISYIAECFEQMVAFFRFFIWMGVFVFLFNFLLNRNGATVLFKIQTNIEILGEVPFTLETIIYAVISILKLMVIILSFSLGNFIINPDDLLRALMKLRLPYVFSLLISMSLRFFPLMLQDIEQISEVQKARGLQLDSGSFVSRIKNRIGLILPLLSNSLDRAVQVAEALESKGFARSNPRTDLKAIKNNIKDWISLIIFTGLLSYLLYNYFNGYGLYEVYPLASIPKILGTDILSLGIFLLTNIAFFAFTNRKFIRITGVARK